MIHMQKLLQKFTVVALAGLTLFVLPHATEARTRVYVGIGAPAPVVVVPPPPVVVVRRPPRVARGYYGYPHRHWRHGYWRYGYRGPRHYYYRWHRW
jgi:hypothetical protein